jgi:DNA polymerase I
MKILTFDLEVENHRLNKRLASPFDPRNYVVEAGWSWNGGVANSQRWNEHHRDDVMAAEFDKLEAGDIINGFNIKFDLLWVWQQKSLQAALKRGAQIYCGQYAEYLMGGHTQDVQMCAMNDIAEKYGGGCKIDAVKEMWEDGCLTSQIPADLLHDYLCGDGKNIVGDIQNTWLIFAGQVARMKAEHPKEFRTMLKFRMDGLLATTEMEYNGVFCDTVEGEQLRIDLVEDLEKARVELEQYIPELPPELVFNWASNTHKSCLIFGGVVKYEKWLPHQDANGNISYAKMDVKYPLFQNIPIPPEECKKAGLLYVHEVPVGTTGSFKHKDTAYLSQDTFKSGMNAGSGKFKTVKVDNPAKPKGAKQPHYFKFDGFTEPHHMWKSDMTDAYDNPLYSTGAKIIEKLSQRGLPFTKALSKHVGLDKDLGTYYWKEDKKGNRKGMLTLVDDDNIIHHKLNHTSTVTSRMSSSDPNLQNVPRADKDKAGVAKSNVKRMFKSRFGKTGRMCEIDYSQLEVVVQGVLTQDPNLRQDLRDRVDFHCKRLSAKLKEDYQHVWNMCHVEENTEYKKGRTSAKIFSFQRAYGAGADTISNETGMPRSEVDALIEAEDILYPLVKVFDQNLASAIDAGRIPTNNNLFINGVAFKQGESHWDAPTGTRYVWREGIAPEFMHAKGKYTGFSPTERKNYPVQGFGGEIVQTMLGLLFRYMIANDRFGGDVLLVNTVHDCVWLDGLEHKIEQVAKEAQAILESVPKTFNEAFSTLEIDVPFPCETEIGQDMFDMNTLH